MGFKFHTNELRTQFINFIENSKLTYRCVSILTGINYAALNKFKNGHTDLTYESGTVLSDFLKNPMEYTQI